MRFAKSPRFPCESMKELVRPVDRPLISTLIDGAANVVAIWTNAVFFSVRST